MPSKMAAINTEVYMIFFKLKGSYSWEFDNCWFNQPELQTVSLGNWRYENNEQIN